MAIQKEHKNYPEAYWMIITLFASKRTYESCARVDVFASKIAKENGEPFIDSFIFEWQSDQYENITNGGIPSAYAQLKIDYIQGGIDV